MKRTKRDAMNRVFAYLIVYGGGALALLALLVVAANLAALVVRVCPPVVGLVFAIAAVAIFLWTERRRNGG